VSKRVWLIGGSGALGTVLRDVLREDGHEVCWTYNTRPPTSPDPRAMALDVRDVSAIERAAQTATELLGTLDAMVYLAAIGTTEPGRLLSFDEVTAHQWDALSEVNLRGAFFAARAFSRVCAQRAMGSAGSVANGETAANIVLAGSIDGHKPVPASVPYAATKGALEALTRSLSKELGPKNICVNALAPGILDGGLSAILPAALVKDYLGHDALSRKGTLREAANVFSYFATENTYVTGKTVAVDGGL
jgi:NAD(P)-dependent dehydrogenase (short-subunit alcohol dehydrogenase family)